MTWLLPLRRGAVAGLLALAGIVLYLGAQLMLGNFHTVIAGELYRSGQPSAEAIEDRSRR